jgi:protease I
VKWPNTVKSAGVEIATLSILILHPIMSSLEKTRVAILATDGFERAELAEPLQALREAGAHADVVSLETGTIRSWDENDWGDQFSVDVALDEASVDGYDALVLPGGTINPDKLRRDERAVSFVRDFVRSGKPVAAICHGPWMLVEADVLRGRHVTSFHAIRTDVKNAGADWVDEEVVVDGNLITSRNPEDLPAFNRSIIDALEQVAA